MEGRSQKLAGYHPRAKVRVGWADSTKMESYPRPASSPWLSDIGAAPIRSTWNTVPAESGDGAAERWLAGVMAHEINNHLAAALMELELAADGSHGPELNALFERLVVAVGSAGEVCRSTLGLLRPEPREASSTGNVAEAVRRAVLCLGRLRSRVRVQIDSGCESLATPLPLAQLQQVVLNLALNALRSSEGEVAVHVGTDAGRANQPTERRAGKQSKPASIKLRDSSESAVCVSVADRGTGMPADIVQRLMAPASAGSIERVSAGGFGLSAVKHLVTSVGGSVRAELPQEGGTRVIVRLPLAEPSKTRRAA